MKNKYFKPIASLLVCSAFLFIAFGSGKSENNSSENEASPTQEETCNKCLKKTKYGKTTEQGNFYCYHCANMLGL